MQRASKKFPWRLLLVALGAYALIQVAFLGLGSIHSGMEAREAAVIDTIMREGQWLIPDMPGQMVPRPGLYHWAGAAFGIVLGGFSELAVRLPSLLTALGVLVCCALAGYNLARISRTTESDLHCERVALFSAGILSLTYGFQQLTVQARGDMSLCFCVWGAIAALLLPARGDLGHVQAIPARNRSLFWLFCALATLTAGLQGLAVPISLAAIGGVWVAGFARTAREIVRPSAGWLALGVTLFVRYVQLRAGDGMAPLGGEGDLGRSWWFYAVSLFRSTFPWGLLVVALAAGMFPRHPTVSYSGGRARVAFLPLVVLAFGVCALSLIRTGWHASLLPIFPLVSIQLALVLSMRIERGGAAVRERLWAIARKAEILLAFIGVCILVVTGLALQGDWSLHPLEEVVKFAFGPFAVRLGTVLLVALVAVVAIQKRSAAVLYCSVWMLMAAVMTILVSAGSVLKSSLTGFSSMSEQILLLVKPGQEIALIADPSDDYFAPMMLYLHRRVRVLVPDASEPLCDPSMLYVARREWLDRHETLVPGELREVAVLQETAHALRRDGIGEVIVFACAPTAYPNDRGERRWHDA